MKYITEFNLKNLKNRPEKLFYKGNLDLLNTTKISIVGSRRCSSYTKNIVLKLSTTLKKYGICVVSGAAIGTDMYAHTGAFPNTIAVFANGLDMIYPVQNSKMIEKIYRDALALSEYEYGISPTPWAFLQRNRIVVGLSDAVVVAQAELKSGSISSARLALEMNIPLFVLPQRLEESLGTNMLVSANKANLICDFDEFAAKFGDKKPVKSTDEIIEFIRLNSDFNSCYSKFGDKLYEYELDGKISIDGINVRLL